MESNDFNKEQYNQNATKYIESNVNREIGGINIEERINLLKRYLPIGSSILELGSGDGKEAEMLLNAGYIVTASDFSEAFLNILKSKNIQAKYFDVTQDTPSKEYSCIYANAVFVHISQKDFKDFLQRCKNNLSKRTMLFATFLKGAGFERSSRGRGFERDFYYYKETVIEELMSAVDFEVKHLKTVDDKWIWLVAQL